MPGKPASGSKQLNGIERARSLRCVGLPRQAMPILKPAIGPNSPRQCSIEPRVGEEVGNVGGYRFQGGVEDAGQAQQRGVDVKWRKIVSPPDQRIDAATACQQPNQRLLTFHEHAAPRPA